jgi:hypothetical protein
MQPYLFDFNQFPDTLLRRDDGFEQVIHPVNDAYCSLPFSTTEDTAPSQPVKTYPVGSSSKRSALAIATRSSYGAEARRATKGQNTRRAKYQARPA